VRVLLIDDDAEVRGVLPAALQRRGIQTRAVEGVADARSCMASESFDALLLDIAMPGTSGMEFLADLRQTGYRDPVILVSAHEAVQERVKGLALGADDYVVKPFDPEELVERIRAVVRRNRRVPVLTRGDLVVDVGRRSVRRAGRKVELSPREFDVLLVLLEADGEVVTRDQLLREVWDMPAEPGTTMVEVQITRLRKKLDRDSPHLIQTVVGRGYRLMPLV